MKSIPNKQTDINKEEGTSGSGEKLLSKCDYAGLIKILVGYPKQGGFEYTDIENRSEISKALKLATEKTGEAEPPNIEMENSYFEYLKKLVKDAKWHFWHEDILKFKEDIMAIK